MAFAAMSIQSEDAFQRFVAMTADPGILQEDQEMARAIQASMRPTATVQRRLFHEPRQDDLDLALALFASLQIGNRRPEVQVGESVIRGRLVKALGNGNCGPNVVTLALLGLEGQELSQQVRTAVVNYYRRNQHRYTEAVRDCGELDLPTQVKAYCDFMSRDRTHFTGVEWVAVAAIYNRYVIVVHAESGVVSDVYGSKDDPWLVVSYQPEIRYGPEHLQRAGHYDALVDTHME
jgi:hypothetical protein